MGMRMRMRIAGIIMIVLTAIVILYNVGIANANKREMREHPWITLLTGGGNLKPCYTFAPPYTGFEIFIFAIGGLGALFLFVSSRKD